MKMMSKNNLSLFHTEYLYSQLALSIPHIKNQLFFMEIINLLTSINEIVKINKKIIQLQYQKYNENSQKQYNLEFIFNNSYSEKEMDIFLNSLSVYLQIKSTDIELVKYSTGSTYITAMIKTTVLLTSLLQSINYFLPQLTEVIENTHNVYKEYKVLKQDFNADSDNVIDILRPMDTTKNKCIIDSNTDKILNIEGVVKVTIS
jgi:hypothetical protein